MCFDKANKRYQAQVPNSGSFRDQIELKFVIKFKQFIGEGSICYMLGHDLVASTSRDFSLVVRKFIAMFSTKVPSKMEEEEMERKKKDMRRRGFKYFLSGSRKR